MLKATRPFWVIYLIAATTFVSLSAKAGRAEESVAEHANSVALLMAAGSAMSAGNIEDAGFFFFAAKARFQIDKQVYPPVGKGGGGPGVLQASLGFSVGQAIVPAVTGDPTIYANVIARLSKWSPQFKAEYDPGWEYENALDKQETADVVVAVRKAMLPPLQQKAKLLGNEEYRRLVTELGEAQAVEQRYWAAARANRGIAPVPIKEEFLAAMAKKSVAAKRMQALEWELNPDLRWHKVVKWNAENYFDDPQVIELCDAIEKNDVPEMKRLIAGGVDVNVLGKDGMTFLLWAFPDRKLERFQCLLEHGANPNVFFESDFNVGRRPFHPYPENKKLFDDRGCHAGQTVTHLACRSPILEYMQLVFSHGGDPNLVDKKTKEAPLGIVLEWSMSNKEKKERVELLVNKQADPNSYCEYRGSYPVVLAVRRHAYDAAISLLQSGANPSLAKPRDSKTLVHWVLLHEEHLPFSDSKRNSDYHALVDWLKEHDAPFDKARADLDRKGRPWGKALRLKREKEDAERQAANKIWARKRAKKLKAIKAADPKAPESVENLVKTLSDQQLKQIELPADPNIHVFDMQKEIPAKTQPEEQSSWFIVHADGRIVCRSRIAPTANPAEARLGKAELTWLMHLAVNECKLLERDALDYERKKRHQRYGVFKYQIAVKSGSSKFQLPQESLVIKPLRKKLDLEKFKVLHTFVGGLANRVHLGDKEKIEKVLKAVNEELQKKHPEMPFFYLHHLELADIGDGTKFVCSFSREFDMGDKRFEKVTAIYVLEGEQPKVTINMQNYNKMR